MKKIFLPQNYNWKEQQGLIREYGQKEEFICDSIPINVKPCKIICEKNQQEKDGYLFYLQDASGSIKGEGEGPFVCTKEELGSSKLLNIILIHTVLGVKSGAREKACGVFNYIIKMACKDQKPELIYQYEFGWNGNKFWWGQKIDISSGEKYANALSICNLFKGNEQIPAAILAGIHGILEKPLQDAGIEHDFVTYFEGETGLGKSVLLRAVCNYHSKTSNMISIGSDHKAIKKFLEGKCDMTIVLDDFCKTISDRVSSSQLKIVSEVIQASSDAAKILVDENSANMPDKQVRHHVVISAEQLIRNESTMNRCFIVHITEPLPEKLFLEIKDMERNYAFYKFLVAFSQYIGDENYNDTVIRLRADYKKYCADTKRLGECTKGSNNRINNTYAVQMVIAQRLMAYFADLKISPDILRKVRNDLESSIGAVCRNLKQNIMTLHKQETHKTYLEPLAEIVGSMSDGSSQGYHLVYSERRFKARNKGYSDAFCIRTDYISFDGKHICELMKTRYGIEGANPKGLSSDLQYYSLAHADSEGKLSCRWGTKGRYYHVRVSDLLDIVVPDLDDTIRDHLAILFDIEYHRKI